MTVSTTDLSGTGTGTGTDRNNYKAVSKINVYDFLTQTYQGSGIYRTGTGLVPHAREMDYASRCEVAFYKNYLRPIVRAMVEPVFTEEAVRKIEDETGNEQTDTMLNAFILDADNDGGSLQDVVEDVVTQARLHGLSFAVIDNYPAKGLAPTVTENIANRTYPYCYLRKANQVYAYELDRFGKLEKIAFYDTAMPKTSASLVNKTEEATTISYIREWDKEKVQRWSKGPKDAKFKLDGPPILHGLGRIPVIVLYSVRRDDKSVLLVDPPLYDIAKLNFTLFNKDSEIREIERAQGFSFLYAQGIEPGDLTIGTNNYLNLPAEASIPPGYCSPNPEIEKTLMANSDAIRQAIYTIAEQNGVTGVTDQSGVAKQWDFFAHESVLKHTSKMAETIEEKIVSIFQAYVETSYIYIVEYKDDFQPASAVKIIEELERYLDLQPVSKGRALAMASVARLVFRDQSPETVAEIALQEETEADDEKKSKAVENVTPALPPELH